ncbi:hypothetical protein VOLCADRAFT_109992 [Volvox carteri f. nagariensis]|uniref:Uncharacterized protein n=1 Tax=Volvox carteri f. nagariensis TaxID=3068 RepID=D8UBG4_VOLCA|nr:uncharacterized protein VOLCADRAFT_109992 [Volvox carteri f. nagariensis]EFJ43000.1 hypothetical protein VOLCADRAFT_109992 [Volvox carteri f. nagariensis]|eukprot:XP_002956040.1 hypothetical protein VOLCADRAFT_109992 [Volvox carteri f. nagariensis]
MLHANLSRSTTARVARQGALPRRAPRGLTTKVRAEKSAIAKFFDSTGMPTDEGYFGFTPFSEMWVGRWSMIGFVSSIVVEFATGKGTLAQIGLPAPSTPFLAAMIALFGGATVVGSVVTVQQLIGRKMSRTQLERYRSFLGLSRKDDWMADQAARDMKRRPDFTSPGFDLGAIDEVRRKGMPADRFLAMDDTAAVERTAEDMKAATSTSASPVAVVAEAADKAPVAPAPPRPQVSMDELYGLDEGKYARDVELANGRAAMLGFLAAILVEAGTGQGIIMQIITYLKWSGLLGPMSGF